ncbi:M56 family metallopeptidase [Clostridium autoethanogenum]|uniref:M56 family metallopeptidase n=1 Tax=Clostridium autoethanogenum TaxID=84023 RepID=UPI0004028D2B|nr:M56 family metallopeptidase [Clostridium autoethanogenum]ALU36104.1 putative membrane protein with peptidase domain [Clostridium autoethanogenum DSM 10061]OVY51838.1 Regulatory protein BlaR1 [Clostridium autoethanogenum]
MEILQRIFLWVLQTSLTASIAILIITLILKLFNNHIGVKFKHALWIIVLIRLIIPVISQNQINLFSIFTRNEQGTSQNKNTIQKRHSLPLNLSGLNQANLNSTKRQPHYNNNIENKQVMYIKDKWQSIDKNKLVVNIYKAASCVWLLGLLIIASIFLLVLVKSKRKFKVLKTLDDTEVLTLIKECKKKADINIDIPIYVYDNFKSPCILGVLKPKIYIPQGLINMDNLKQFSYIILHELVHYKRKDLFYNSLSIVAVLIHWFNPLVWFAMNKMKLQRECACDACVLEILGEKETVDYGMTLINFSRKSLNLARYPQAAIFFETESQIEGRIKMITKFKKGSYKMSASAALCCVLVGGLTLVNGISVKAVGPNAIPAVTSSSTMSSAQKIQFLVDSQVKEYDNLAKAQTVAGFKFKVPDYMPAGYKVINYFQVEKISDKDNFLSISFNDKYNMPNIPIDRISFKVFHTNYAEVLKKVVDLDPQFEKDGGKVETSEQPMKLGEINGTSVTAKFFTPAQKNQGKDTQSVSKYFIWQDEGNWYSLEYSGVYQGIESVNLSQDEIEKIASSIRYPEEVKKLDYNTPGKSSDYEIYDKDDLKAAENALGFKFKFPNSANKDIKISSAFVSKENKYFGIEYCKNNAVVGNLLQTKDYKQYEEARNTGYVTIAGLGGSLTKNKTQLLNIAGKQVFKYEYELKNGEGNKEKVYIWSENGVCYKFDSSSSNKNGLSENELNELINLVVGSSTFEQSGN